ncbi:hypothetical protein [Algoriphagus marinus]|uniref:hypothetical protein n=1 Tax=Algoriphagus marinus TaxID=1925762 RepID=UPI00094B9218|nr:hypothetical protein [Algoriphagus marinus]
MSQLNQIIASLLSDINEAKAKADEASRNLALTYSSDDVLQFFPVPKIGIQNLEVELKYAIEGVEEKPFQTSQSKERLENYVKNFSAETAREIRSEITKVASKNDLYKSLGGNYPDENWEGNVSKLISTQLESLTNPGNDVSKNIQNAKKSLEGDFPQIIPTVMKSAGFAVVPTGKGSFELLGISDNDEVDFRVTKDYRTNQEALNDAKQLSSSIASNKASVSDFKKDAVTKNDLASIKIGNIQLPIEVESKKVGSSQPKAFFETLVTNKAISIKNPTVKQPWVIGRPTPKPKPNSPNTPDRAEIEEDESLREIAKEVLKKRMIQLEAGIGKIAEETKSTSLRVAVDSEKLSKVKPENVMTIKFTLNSQDFTMMDDNSKPSIL